MDFTPKNWEDVPSAATPINAAALEDAETRVTDYTDTNIRVVGETLDVDITNTTDEATAIQTALNNLDTQGSGRLLLPNTNSGAIKIGSLIEVPALVNINGQGKYETQLKCSAAAAGIKFKGVGDTPSDSRGGRSGGFMINGNQLASECMRSHAVNRVFEDIHISSPKAAGGVALMLYGSQNNCFIGLSAEDSFHTSSSTVRGVVLDGGASGNNFFSTSLNEFTDGHVLIDSSSANPGLPSGYYSSNNWFYGNMIERSDSGNPVIRIKAGVSNGFVGGNITLGTDFKPTAECNLVYIDNSAARGYSVIGSGGAPTKNIGFSGITFTCPLASDGTTRWGNTFYLGSDLTSWHDILNVDAACSYANTKYVARIAAATVHTRIAAPDDSSGGGLVGWSNPSGAGKINTRLQAAANTIATKATIDYYELSGNTNINTLNATYSGHQITLKFSGTPTVSSSAGNIKLAGGVDMAATANDILCLICDETNWHETSRVVK